MQHGEEKEPGGRPLRILLAEDSRINQLVAAGMLEKHGHQVVIAADGREAVEAFVNQEFDLVLMDVQMPGMDGLEATRLIRQHEASTGRRIPIVAMTAHAIAGYKEQCLESGMDDYVAKPVKARELLEAVTRASSASESSPR